jgi:tetratricopeptide (TPR) repeat protein
MRPALKRRLLWGGLAAATLAGGALRFQAARPLLGLPPASLTDASDYWEIGGAIANGEGFALDGRPTASRGVLYPALIAAVRRVFPLGGTAPLRLLLVLLGTAMIPLAFLLGRALGSDEAGAAGAFLVAFNEAQVLFSASLGVDVLYSLLLLGTAFALVRWAEKPSAKSAAALGAVLGLSLWCRSTLILFPFALAGWAAFNLWEPRRWVPLLALPLLLAAPWTVRNGLVVGHWSPFETPGFGPVFWEGTRQVERGRYLSESEPYVTIMTSFPPARWNALMTRAGLDNVRRRPARWTALCLTRAAKLWLGSGTSTVDDVAPPPWLPRAGPAGVWAGALLVLAGLWSGRGRPGARALFALLAYYNVHALLALQPRYGSHLGGPLCALAGVGIALLAGAGARRWLPRVALPAALLLAPGVRSAPSVEEGASLYLAERFPEALAAFDQALALKPSHAESLFNRAACQVMLGRYEAARADLDRLLGLKIPAALRALAYRRRAALRVTLGDVPGARSDARAGLAIAPHGSGIARELETAAAILAR